jgi:hypothetical protein
MKSFQQYITEKLILKKNISIDFIDYFAKHLNLEKDNEIVKLMSEYIEETYGDSVLEIRAIRSDKHFIPDTEHLYELDEKTWKTLYKEFGDDCDFIKEWPTNPPCNRYISYFLCNYKNYVGIDAVRNGKGYSEMVFFEIITK